MESIPMFIFGCLTGLCISSIIVAATFGEMTPIRTLVWIGLNLLAVIIHPWIIATMFFRGYIAAGLVLLIAFDAGDIAMIMHRKERLREYHQLKDEE